MIEELKNLLNEQQEYIEELQVSDEIGWKRAEYFEKDLHNKNMYIKRLEYKVQKFKEENEQLKKDIELYKYESKATIQFLQDDNNKLRKELNDCEKFRYQVFNKMGELNK